MVATAYQQVSKRVHKSGGVAPADVAPRSKPKTDNRARVMLRFFLDKAKADEQELIDEVDSLKKERQFAPTIRDGLRLMRDLRAGRFDALFDLFDWIPAWIDTEVERRINERMQDTNTRLARLEAQIALLSVPPPSIAPAPRPLPVAPGPADEDAPLVMRKAASDGKASANNFLNSAFALLDATSTKVQ